MSNRLAFAKSPYLLQHADNPVDWYPWGEEALEKARKENKPILLSIGYAACHWCHVMAHESFEDKPTAKLMNELFVNIKVDREERPDLDRIYQTAYQLLNQRGGGWPLTVFLTPEKLIPFFVGTYFPLETINQIPSFKEVLKFVTDIYKNQQAEIEKQNNALIEAFNRLHPKYSAGPSLFDLTPLSLAQQNLILSFDKKHGGFNGAPKFPQVLHLEQLIKQYFREKTDVNPIEMVELTLTKMAEGGIYDQIGGGFFRYSVDAEWQIPHFEKMLYDNALLLNIYAQMTALDQDFFYRQILQETAEWIIRYMQSPEGGFYSSLDADSEGEEGKFYAWDLKEIEKILSPEEWQIAEIYYGLDQPANFETKWHLHVANDVKATASQLNWTHEITSEHLKSIRKKLFTAREKRVHPQRDEKILTAWNALMIKSLANAGRYAADKTFIVAAEKSLAFIQKNLWKNERLLAVYKDGEAYQPAFLDDYVFLIDAILILLQVRWRTEDLEFAKKLADMILVHFQDKINGGFFFTADDQENLFYRPKNLIDEALPSGNGIAVKVLTELGYLLGDTQYLTAAENTLKLVWPELQKFPDVYATLLLALETFLAPPEIIILRGKESMMRKWLKKVNSEQQIRNLFFCISDKTNNLSILLTEKKPLMDTVAYICKGYECQKPITDMNEFQKYYESRLTNKNKVTRH